MYVIVLFEFRTLRLNKNCFVLFGKRGKLTRYLFFSKTNQARAGDFFRVEGNCKKKIANDFLQLKLEPFLKND